MPDRLVRAIRAQSRLMVRELGLLSSRHVGSGVTYAQAHVLLELEDRGHCTVMELADALAIEKSAVSRTVAILVREGWVSLEEDAEDGRRKYAQLTRSGSDCVARLHRIADGEVASALEHVSEQEREEIARGLGLYAHALRHARTRREVEIRHIRRQDGARLKQLASQYHREVRHSVVGGKLDPGGLYRQYSQPDASYLVAERRDVVVGGIGYRPVEGAAGLARLGHLYCFPDARGAGIGETLLAACQREAESAGFSTLLAEVESRPSAARHLLERHGFKPGEKPPGTLSDFRQSQWLSRSLNPR